MTHGYRVAIVVVMSENKREYSIEVYKGLEFQVTWEDPDEEGKQWGRAVSGDIEFTVRNADSYGWWVSLCGSDGFIGEVCGIGNTFPGAVEHALTNLESATKDAHRLAAAVRNA